MKLIKINPIYYIIVDKLKIESLDWIKDSRGIRQVISTDGIQFGEDVMKVTHSTVPLLAGKSTGPLNISLSNIMQILGEVDVQSKAKNYSYFGNEEFNETSERDYLVGYYQACRDLQSKRYTIDDMRLMFMCDSSLDFTDCLNELEPKTEWNLEFVDGQFRLL